MVLAGRVPSKNLRSWRTVGSGCAGGMTGQVSIRLNGRRFGAIPRSDLWRPSVACCGMATHQLNRSDTDNQYRVGGFYAWWDSKWRGYG
jgi:hypothetical protein